MLALISTGGTIAGLADSQTQSNSYKVGNADVLSVLGALDSENFRIYDDFSQIERDFSESKSANFKENTPKTSPDSEIFEIYHCALFNTDSAQMDFEKLFALKAQIEKMLENEKIRAIVITHGTDTLEETAFFLHLTIFPNKPIILSGSMRPQNALSSDCAKNLFNAFKLAKQLADSEKSGIFATLNDRIFSARDLRKIHTLNLDAFSGQVGYILDSGAIFENPNFENLSTQHFQNLNIFENLNSENLSESAPKVFIIYAHAGDECAQIADMIFQNLNSQNCQKIGIVVASFGAGNLSQNLQEILLKLAKNGVPIVISSRVFGTLIPRRNDFISAKNLNSQKARILLFLSMLKNFSHQEIAQIFWDC